MSFERGTAGTGLGAEAAAPPPETADAVGATASGISPSMRLQILSTEHWSLLASRSLAWNESFSRAGMFLSTLSGAIVALALVAQATEFGEGFTLFALVILPVVLFVGLTTLVRLGASNYHDAQCVIGMNRIRAGYLEMAPELERFFVMGVHDDVPGLSITMGLEPGASQFVHGIAATPAVVSVLNSVLVGVIVALAAFALGVATIGALALALAGVVVTFALLGLWATRAIRRGQASVRPIFPSPSGER